MNERDVGESLIRVRRLRMWTQVRLAKEAGVSPTTVSGIESGKVSSPQFGTIRKLAQALGVDPRQLLHLREVIEPSGPPPLSLGWARSAREEEFERGLEDASLESLDSLSRELGEERERLQRLYGEFPRGSEQRRLIKRRIRDVSAQSGSVETSMLFHQGSEAGHPEEGSPEPRRGGS